MNIQKDSIVTLELNKSSSNTFIVDTVESDTILLTHPLAPNVLLRVAKNKVDITSATIKDSYERCIDYANSNKDFLDHNTKMDLEAIGIYFVIKRKLTPKQKQMLAGITGNLANIKFNNDLKEAMSFITKNSYLLDEFNLLWYNNFRGLFTGQQVITSEKQRSAIFNIAGYLLAELKNPTAKTRK